MFLFFSFCRLGKMQKDIAEAEDHCKRLQKVRLEAA